MIRKSERPLTCPRRRKELREAWRTSRLPVIVLIFFALGLMSPLLAKYTPELLKSLGGSITIVVPPPQTSDAVDQFLKNVGQNGIIIAIHEWVATYGEPPRAADWNPSSAKWSGP